jgi:uncharacterized protein (TIGR03067 family)
LIIARPIVHVHSSERIMTTFLELMLATGLIVGTGAKQEKKEVEKFRGTWTVAELTYNGKDHSKLKFNFVFKGSEVVVEGDEKVKVEYAKLKFKIDTSTTPKIFDMTITDGIQKDAAMEGIYEFKGADELRICATVFGKDRPAEFSSPDGKSIVLMVLKRAP